MKGMNQISYYAYFHANGRTRHRSLHGASLLLLNLTAAILILFFSGHIKNLAVPFELIEINSSMDQFRALNISEESLSKLHKFSDKHKLNFYEVLTVNMIANHFELREDAQICSAFEYNRLLERYKTKAEESFNWIQNSYETIWKDIEFFPVPESTINEEAKVSFTDSWMYERNYGGKRGHEGTDIMAEINKRGIYPIVSMCDGVVEKIGWLEQGGYRIGIRSNSGAYFYYAHLYRYQKEFKIGEKINAGEVIGFMGDSGYGEEGTIGEFPVHLHVGIYIDNEDGEEMSVNPYPILKKVEDKRLRFAY